MRQPLALKYRPRIWSDLVGQEIIVKILTGMILDNRLHPFLVFGGSRGLGKTTASRILAKALNCAHRNGADPCNECESCLAIDHDTCPDVLELDAASNGGVTSIRRIREVAAYTTIMVPNRVIILDEAHAMTREALQAMLKILEEPPEHTLFVMATTEAHQLPDTIISRSFPFDFRRISARSIQERLTMIVAKEHLDVEPSALAAISVHVSGGMRDAITVLEQACNLGVTVCEGTIIDMLGLLVRRDVAELFDYIISGRKAKVFLWVKTVNDRGIEARVALGSILRYVRDLMAISVGYNPDLDESAAIIAQKQAEALGRDQLLKIAFTIMDLETKIHHSLLPGPVMLDIVLSSIVLGG